MLGRVGNRFFSRTSRVLTRLSASKAPSFLKLLQYHQNGKLFINQIVSPPRTGSTLLFRALAEAKEVSDCDQVTGAIFEPFLNRKDISWEEKLEHGAKIILQRVELLGVNQQPVTLVMKEIAAYLPIEIMQHWQEVVSNFIFLIDDPHKQMYSFLQMLANGRKFGLKDAAGKPLLNSENNVVMHSETEMRALWPAVTEMLAKNHFQQTAWEHLVKIIDLVTQHCAHLNHKKMVIVDGSILKLAPEQTLTHLTKKLDRCTYMPAMVSSWTRTSGKLFFHPNAPGYDPVGRDGVTRSMWIWPALKATTFSLPAISQPTDTFPPQLAEHILKEALPAYYYLMKDPAFLMPTDMAPLIEKGSASCPITLIALLQILMDRKSQSQEQYNQALSCYQSIMREHPEFSLAFDVLSERHRTPAEKRGFR